MKEKVAVILGPTATGKSRVGIEIAKALDGEIISGDSMLVYRTMDIGTAKPSAEELAMVPHHLIDILEPGERFNVYQFQQKAGELITKINSRGHLPVIVGGTGLYIQALLEDYDFDAPDGNQKRPGKYDSVVFGLKMERQFLYRRIEERVDAMLGAGLEKEVRGLLEKGLDPGCQSMRSIGYRQMIWYLKDGMPYDEMVAKLKQATRNFAKRQFTWYRHMDYVEWFNIEENLDYDSVVGQMLNILVKRFKLG